MSISGVYARAPKVDILNITCDVEQTSIASGSKMGFRKPIFARTYCSVLSRVKYVYIYTIYTWKSVYRVWSDFRGVYRVEVYTGF